MTEEFFAAVQNKMLYAATGKTARRNLISSRADAALPNMGLTTWKGAGHGRDILT